MLLSILQPDHVIKITSGLTRDRSQLECTRLGSPDRLGVGDVGDAEVPTLSRDNSRKALVKQPLIIRRATGVSVDCPSPDSPSLCESRSSAMRRS